MKGGNLILIYSLRMKSKMTIKIKMISASIKLLCELETVVLRGESITAGNKKINENFLKKGFNR